MCIRDRSKKIREELWEKAGGRCQICDSPLDPLTAQIDHIVPVARGINKHVNDISNYRLLDPTCHASVTTPGNTKNVLMSHFNAQTWNFVTSPMPQPMIQKVNKIVGGSLIHLDIIRSRARALSESFTEFPLICAFDEIQTYKSVSDWNFVKVAAPKTARGQIRMCPIQGEGWYSREATTYALKHSLIRESDITHQLNGSARLPKDFFKDALSLLDECWENPDLRKKSTNSFLGLLYVDHKRAAYRVETTTEEEV